MSIFNNLMGNATEKSVDKTTEDLSGILFDGEVVEKSYQNFRDLFVFTNARLILVDKQGITGKKVSYHCIPYKSITYFTTETAGTFDLDAELKIFISGGGVIEKEFKKGSHINDINKTLGKYTSNFK